MEPHVAYMSKLFMIRDQLAGIQMMIFCDAGEPRLKCHQLRITMAASCVPSTILLLYC